MACMISKTTNIAAKILTEINQEIESCSFKNRAIILQFTIDYFLFKHNFGCNNFLACIVLVCQISLLLSMVNSPTGLEKQLSGSKPWMLFQRFQVQSSAPTWWLSTICSSTSRDWTPGTQVKNMHKIKIKINHFLKLVICVKRQNILRDLLNGHQSWLRWLFPFFLANLIKFIYACLHQLDQPCRH